MSSWVLQGRHQLFKRNTDSVSMVLSSIISGLGLFFLCQCPHLRLPNFTLLHFNHNRFFFALFPFLAILALYFLGPPFNNIVIIISVWGNRGIINNYSSSPNRLWVNSGRMGYWLRGHEGERNNCFRKIQLVGEKFRDKTTLASKTRFSRHCFCFQSRCFLLLVGYNI